METSGNQGKSLEIHKRTINLEHPNDFGPRTCMNIRECFYLPFYKRYEGCFNDCGNQTRPITVISSGVGCIISTCHGSTLYNLYCFSRSINHNQGLEGRQRRDQVYGDKRCRRHGEVSELGGSDQAPGDGHPQHHSTREEGSQARVSSHRQPSASRHVLVSDFLTLYILKLYRMKK